MAEQIDPWGSIQIENYEETMEKFGIEPLKDLKDRIPDKNRYIRRDIIYGHRDFGRVLDAMEEGNDWSMMTGLMPSGNFHFGHKMLADQFVWYQEMGAELYIAVADVEAYLTRDMSLEQAREIAIEEYLKNYIALGLEPENVNFYFQSEGGTHYNTISKLFAKNVTQNEVEAVYGDVNPGKVTSALTQAADILQPEFDENGGPKPVVVPVGTDQDPHIRLTRDIASRFPHQEFVKPSSTYHKFMRGLQGGKMSSSKENSYIALSESPDSACEKIDRAKTGGRQSKEEQRKKGAVIEEDTVFELLAFHLIDDDDRLRDIHEKYSSGEMLSGELKQIAKEELRDFLEHHQRRLEEADERVEEFIH
ncbi:MAG: tryptophan--tRNA ligase [Candidatus Nanohaloarchaeota archaeon QJJ-7]|nr:tryptophan--tRNA ligase [Candidatus Nanohaloarchaeota archaeon QJJ-7]